MKKLILGALLLLSVISCKKEEKLPVPCNCGAIIDDPIVGSQYGLTIKNDCSGNQKTFYFTAEVWATAYVGTNFCVSNVQSW
jgi:hypothetical protein